MCRKNEDPLVTLSPEMTSIYGLVGFKDSMGFKNSVFMAGLMGFKCWSVKQFDLVFSAIIVALSVCRTWRVPGFGPWRDQFPCASGESNGQWAPEGGDGEPDLRHP